MATDTAALFQNYAQLMSQQNQNFGQQLSGAIDLYSQIRAKREANLAAERMKQAEIQAKQEQMAMEMAQKQREESMKPQAILAKALQFGPEALTPEERAVFNAEQQIQGAKIIYDQFNQVRAGYTPISLGGAPAPAVGVQVPSMVAPSAQGMLTPPRLDGAAGTPEQFAADMGTQERAPSPVGYADEKAAKPQDMNVATTAEQRLAQAGVTRPKRPAVMDFASAEQYKADIAAYNDALKAERENIFTEQKQKRDEVKNAPFLISELNRSISTIDKAIGQTNKLNTGFLGGRTVMGANLNPFAQNVEANLGNIQAQTALEALIAAKDQGATFGALSDAELQLIKDKTASLSRTQTEAQLDENLQFLANKYRDIRKRIAEKAGIKLDSTEGAPEIGAVKDGWRFLGGDPSKKENWERVR